MRTYSNLKPKPHKTAIDLLQLLESSAEAFGEKPVYIYKENHEVVTYSYNEHYVNMLRLGTAFAAIGLMGRNIAVIGKTHPRWLNTFYSTIIGGGTIVPLDPELEISQIVNFLNRADCVAVVYADHFNNVLTEQMDALPEIKYFIPMADGENSPSDKVRTFSSLLALGKEKIAEGDRTFIDHPVELEKRAAILFTSGTTGTSKGVMLSHKNFIVACNAACDSTSFDDTSTLVSVLPVHHTYELTCIHLAAVNMGASIYINESLRQTTKSFAYFKPSGLVLVPLFMETIHKKIWEEIRRKGMEKKVRAAMQLSAALLKTGVDIRPKLFGEILSVFGGNLKYIIVGGAPISPKIVKEFYLFGITVAQGYGITECSPLVAVNRATRVKFDSIGQVVDNCEVRLDFMEESENGEGELLVRGGNVMMGYYKDEEATKAAFTEDGWFRTGDIGTIDRDGYITITGRKKNVIIASNGKNVYPEELEEYLAPIPEIAECVVLGRKNKDGNTVITAIVVPDMDVIGDKNDEEVIVLMKRAINDINRTLPSYKAIRNVEIRHEEFEKTSAKKIKRYVLQ